MIHCSDESLIELDFQFFQNIIIIIIFLMHSRLAPVIQVLVGDSSVDSVLINSMHCITSSLAFWQDAKKMSFGCWRNF